MRETDGSIRGMYIRNTADIPPNGDDICNAYKNELGEIMVKNEVIINGYIY